MSRTPTSRRPPDTRADGNAIIRAIRAPAAYNRARSTYASIPRDVSNYFFFFSSRRRHTRWPRDWSSDVCSSDLYLKDLGVTTLWLTPIVKNGAAQDYHGYGAVDLYAVDPHLGALKDYVDLVAAAHKQGMKIFFDVVPNHVGPKHPWVANPPLPDWLHGTLEHHIDSFSPLQSSFYGKAGSQAIGNDPFESLIDPHAPLRMKRNLTEGWFFGILPDMNKIGRASCRERV